ncbi:hypothetical protein VHUM_01743 [Vanrija humicola]|uniref:Guanine nucleotide-binding protein-like 1 n=1 Tax=Vanrija humicola TaxID=5417 RepID=A0A7D8V095_VANHU|nr:hypothetical protein VHUM_01743 [Vanrija humicola]
MGRKKPFSHKQKKAQLQTSRARKRGDDDEDGGGRQSNTRQHRRPLPSRSAPKGPTLRLESRFISLPPHYLERTRDLAFSTPLERPLPGTAAVFPVDVVTRSPPTGKLVIPARPKFRYGQTKKEVEKNEEGVYKKWLSGTRATLDEWVLGEEENGWPVSPSWFETNLEVWRQLWRVTESSAILLLLIDSRCPPLHCPPSLRTYVKALKPRKEVILVLTKADLVDAGALAGWRTWLKDWWTEGDEPGAASTVQIVAVSSYDKALLYGEGRARHRPAIPMSARGELVEAVKTAHARLVTKPSNARDDWKPSSGGRRKAKQEDAGDGAEEVEGAESGEEGEADEAEEEETRHQRDPQSEPLPIGLIGQPNVGKSSLLNALLGTTRVRASKTPGKTKHFQTILWGPVRDIKIIDCPGLVCPSLVPMELQAMAGTNRMPIEEVFRVPAPAEEEVVVDKRTWRGEGPRVVEAKGHTWTAGGIMEARAIDRGFLTAKGGRPDTNRAGNAMLRTIADGRVRWGFWPPGSSEEALAERGGKGVWLENTPELDDEEAGGERSEESESEEDEASGVGAVPGSDDAEEEEESESESEDTGFAAQNHRSFFNALSLEGSDESESEETDSGDSDDSLPPHTPS